MSEFPPDLPLVLDRSVRRSRGGRVLVGGEPPRALRLSVAGADVLDRLMSTGAGSSPAARRLARRMVDGGLAHPHPAPVSTTAADVTIVIPVRDRPAELDACLQSMAGGVPVVVVDDGSREAAAIARLCARHGARLVRRESAGGPARARNTALEHVETPLVAFLDSDCVAPLDWLAALIGHFADPLVGAVAPRVRGAPGASGAVGRFAAARAPIDLGNRPARVMPMRRVAYVPTAALIVRRAAVRDGFDPGLRYGEDVDLVWRLHDAGWQVRYDPGVTVRHREPARWRSLIVRRYRYGTSAAALASRHPGRLAPWVVHPWSAAVAAFALARRPRIAAAIVVVQSILSIRKLRRIGVPPGHAAGWPARGAVQTALGAGRAASTLTPALLVAALACRRTRLAALLLLAAPPIAEWANRRPPLDPVRWTLLCLADDAAYGAGVWAGSLRARSLAAVMPVRADRQD